MSGSPSKSSQNVRVFARFRPFNSRERALTKSGGDADFKDWQLLFDEDKHKWVKLAGRWKDQNDYQFNGDQIFDMETNQAEVFDSVAKSTVDDILKGFNGTIFAYGQSGSGKTYCMFGPSLKELQSQVCSEGEASKLDVTVREKLAILKGVVPRCADRLFENITASPDITEAKIQVSLLEIYRESIQDLLVPGNSNLKIRQEPNGNNSVRGLTEVCVAKADDIYDLIDEAMDNRAVASTGMNATSSRSHCVLIITLHQSLKNGLIKTGKLNMIDLAGSEKIKNTGAVGLTLMEAKKINQSLSSLGNCINALTDKKRKHIPFRDSKLTHLLQSSLGGNCKTSLIVACSPSPHNQDETLSTLQFAQRAKSVSTTAVVNQQKSVKELMKENAALKKELAMYKNSKTPPPDAPDNDEWMLKSSHTMTIDEWEEKFATLNQKYNSIREDNSKFEEQVADLEQLLAQTDSNTTCSYCSGGSSSTQTVTLVRRSSILLPNTPKNKPQINRRASLTNLTRRSSLSGAKFVKLVQRDRKKRNATGHHKGKHKIDNTIAQFQRDIVLACKVCAVEFEDVECHEVEADVAKSLIKPNQWLFGSKTKEVPKVLHYWFEIHTPTRFYLIQKTRNGDLHFNVFETLVDLQKTTRETANSAKNAKIKKIESLTAPNSKDLKTLVKLEESGESDTSTKGQVIRILDVKIYLLLFPAVYHVLRHTSKELALEMFDWWKQKFVGLR